MKVKSYIIVGKSKVSDAITCQIENSFSMGFSSERVKVYRSNLFGRTSKLDYYRWLKNQAEAYNKCHPSFEFNVYRVGSKLCPISINWKEFNDMISKKIKPNKYDLRNLPFKIKENV